MLSGSDSLLTFGSCRLFEDAVRYCQQVQAAQNRYAEQRLSWAINRAFCWHSLAIQLSVVLRHHALSNLPEGKWALERIAEIFSDKPSIEWMKGNGVLWQPLEHLNAELNLRAGGTGLIPQVQHPQEVLTGVDWQLDDLVWE